ncbi:hypothetical protein P253_00791 [Acinetobacter indicus CIP 110367]|uniref:Integrase catalytic domain-containing protein n=1 Tax=Acinetobacter indicus CIP 110367 TaxID=1341679 RepID=V2VQE5_9GAMM|nr:hypothetical protein F956_00136 [Acinetobacter indicus ANC 4215]ESK49934.1 hypothetical protein P253_00791 [Acinetobacter indicus CIP 110367]
MIAADLWMPRSKRLKRPYQPRYNRDCFGELIQIDGSHHDWFEGRAAKCCLLVFIDDATGKLQHLRFCESESTFDYMISTRLYVEQHGKPLAFYSDKHSVFRVNQSSKKDTKITQFGRVLSTLNIDIIFANSLLSPPPEVEEALVEAAVVEAMQLENQWAAVPADQHSYDPAVEDLHAHSHVNPSIVSADRKWHKMNPRYKQRLLMVFKIMKERHGYELVLLEGYRSPERQNSLSKNKNTTRARGYQSYHQFGLAADVAFKRNGKVVISERDPWAMRGYELYGEVAESVGLTWGGRWKSIKDYGHTEYRMPGLKKTREMAEKLTSEGQLMANALD